MFYSNQNRKLLVAQVFNLCGDGLEARLTGYRCYCVVLVHRVGAAHRFFP